MNQYQVPDEAIAAGIIDLEYHDRLLLNLDKYSKEAGIHPYFCASKLSLYCNQKEVGWVRKLNLDVDNGMIINHVSEDIPIEDKMSAIAGACLRNYISAMVMPVQEALYLTLEHEMPKPTVLLIPNFCLGSTDEIGGLHPWQVSALLGMLYSRLARNSHTVLYVESEQALIAQYGPAFLQHFKAHYFNP